MQFLAAEYEDACVGRADESDSPRSPFQNNDSTAGSNITAVAPTPLKNEIKANADNHLPPDIPI